MFSSQLRPVKPGLQRQKYEFSVSLSAALLQ